MAILKKGNYNVGNISSFSLNNVIIDNKSNVETMKFDKEEYLRMLEEGKQIGYQEGFESGYNEGYTNGYTTGIDKLEEEKKLVYQQIDIDKNALSQYLDSESLKYIENFKNDINSIILNTMNMIFLDAINDEVIMKRYISNLVVYISSTYKESSILMNSYTLSILNQNNDNICRIQIDESLDNYDVSVRTAKESLEFNLKENFEKIQLLFS